MALEQVAQPRAGTMEEDTLVGVGDSQGVTDFLSGQPFDVVEDEHGALVLRQSGNRTLEKLAHFRGQHRSFRRLWPGGGGRLPVAVPAVAGGAEPVGSDRRLVSSGLSVER